MGETSESGKEHWETRVWLSGTARSVRRVQETSCDRSVSNCVWHFSHLGGGLHHSLCPGMYYHPNGNATSKWYLLALGPCELLDD